MPRYKEIRFFKPFNLDYAFHFFLLQSVGATYMIYRLMSRDYTYLGFFKSADQIYPRGLFHELFPLPISYFTTFQFIYEVLPFPSPFFIGILEGVIIVSAILLLLGIFPKLCSIICLIIYAHILGIMQSIDAEIDGGTILLVLFFILSISPKHFFYKIGEFDYRKKQLNWPIFLFFLFIGAFYFFAGLNKIIDVGFKFPFTLDLEKINQLTTEQSIFLSSRNYSPSIASHPIMLNETFSDVSGLITIIIELGFLSILFLPRYRLFMIFSAIILHVIVFITLAINFIGSSFVLLLCFDWNILIRDLKLVYDDGCGFCKKSLNFLKRFDYLNRIKLIPSNKIKQNEYGFENVRLNCEIGAVDENEEIYYGADAFEQIFSRIIFFWPIAIFMKIPGVIYIARVIYKIIAKNRTKLTKEGCEV